MATYAPIAGTGPLPGTFPMGNAKLEPGHRPLGPPVMVPREEHAFITDNTLLKLLDPKNLNESQLQDIYQVREDDFETPEELEVWYMDHKGKPVKEFLFVDPLHSNERPRLCVSLKAVEAMHRGIAVLTRKLDNVLLTLRRCRSDYYRELVLLRELVHRKHKGYDKVVNEDGTVETVDHAGFFFDPNSYQDEVSVQLFQERIDQATADMKDKLQGKNKEIGKLYQRIQKMETGFDALDRAEQKDYEDQLAEALAELEVVKEERDEREKDAEESEDRVQILREKINSLKEEVALARELVQKKDDKHHKQMDREYEEKLALERRLDKERTINQETLKRERAEWAEEREDMERVIHALEHQLAATKHSLQIKNRTTARKSQKLAHPDSAAIMAEDGDFSPGSSRYPTERRLGTEVMSNFDMDEYALSPRATTSRHTTVNFSPGHLEVPIGGVDGGFVSREPSMREFDNVSPRQTASPEENARVKEALQEQLQERRKTASSHVPKAADKQTDEVKRDGEQGDDVVSEEDEKTEAEREEERAEIERLWESVYKKPTQDNDHRLDSKAPEDMNTGQLYSRIMADAEALADKAPQVCLEVAFVLTGSMGNTELQELQSFLAGVLGVNTSSPPSRGQSRQYSHRDVDGKTQGGTSPRSASRRIEGDHVDVYVQSSDTEHGGRKGDAPRHLGTYALGHDRSAKSPMTDYGSQPTTAQSGTTIGGPSEISRRGLDSGGRDALDSDGSSWRRVDTADASPFERSGSLDREFSDSRGRDALDSAGSMGGSGTYSSARVVGGDGTHSSPRVHREPNSLRRLDEEGAERDRYASKESKRSFESDSEEEEDENGGRSDERNRASDGRSFKRQQSLPVGTHKGERSFNRQQSLDASYGSKLSSEDMQRRSRHGSRESSHQRHASNDSRRSSRRSSRERWRAGKHGRIGRNSSSDTIQLPKRSRSIGPSWSMPMHSDAASHVSQDDWGFGLGRLTMALENLPMRHNQVAMELMSVGWVLYDPFGSCHSTDRPYPDEPEPEMEVGEYRDKRSSRRKRATNNKVPESRDDPEGGSSEVVYGQDWWRGLQPAGGGGGGLASFGGVHHEHGGAEEMKGLVLMGNAVGAGRDGNTSTQAQQNFGGNRRQTVTMAGGGRPGTTARQALAVKRGLKLLHKAGHLEAESFAHMIDHHNLMTQGTNTLKRASIAPGSTMQQLIEEKGRSPRKSLAAEGLKLGGMVQFQFDATGSLKDARRGSQLVTSKCDTKTLAHTRSVGVQTSIAVVDDSHFEVLQDKDDKALHQYSTHLDKELLRARIAQELITLAEELCKFAGVEGRKGATDATPRTLHRNEHAFKQHDLVPHGVGKDRALLQEEHSSATMDKFTVHGQGALHKSGHGHASRKSGHGSAHLVSTRPSPWSQDKKTDSFSDVIKGSSQDHAQEKRPLPTKKSLLPNSHKEPTEEEDDDDPSAPPGHGHTGKLKKGLASYDTCVHCGVAFVDESLFCRRCGERRGPMQILTTSRCQCGVLLKAGTVLCPGCGTSRAGMATPYHSNQKITASMSSLPPSDHFNSIDNLQESQMSTVSTNVSVSSTGRNNRRQPTKEMALEGNSLATNSLVSDPWSPESSRADLKLGDDSDDDDDFAAGLSPAGPALSARSLGRRRSSGHNVVAAHQLGAQNLSNFSRYFGDMFDGEQDLPDAKSLPPLDDAVIDRSRRFLQEDERKHGGGPPRTPGRPQTQGGAGPRTPRRISESAMKLPPASLPATESIDQFYPKKTTGGLSVLPLQALLRN